MLLTFHENNELAIAKGRIIIKTDLSFQFRWGSTKHYALMSIKAKIQNNQSILKTFSRNAMHKVYHKHFVIQMFLPKN